MRLNRFCGNCMAMKDANYENLCANCAEVTKTVLTDPENAHIGVMALQRKIQAALSEHRQPLGMESKPDARTLTDRMTGDIRR